MRKLMIAFIAAAFLLAGWVPPAGAAQSSVTIAGTGCPGGSLFCFTPANITIHDGDTVVWTNQTAAPHTVTRCTAAACAGTGGGTGTDASFTSGNVAAGTGGTFAHTFHGSGSYVYYCTIHGFPLMHGTVTVMASATATTVPAPSVATPAAGSTAAGPTAAAPQAASGASGSMRSGGVSHAALPRTGVEHVGVGDRRGRTGRHRCAPRTRQTSRDPCRRLPVFPFAG
jgi:plastocyanin